MTLIDTHVHIDFYPDPLSIANSYENKGIYALFVTNLPELFAKHIITFNQFRYVRLCLGYHPQVTSEYEFNYQLFKENISKTKYIGEVGLDYKNEFPAIRKKQCEAFEYITSPEFSNGRIYTIHSNHAEDDILNILESNKVKHAIIHWYTGKITTLDKLVDQGYYFSINPKMISSKKGMKVIERIPKSLLLFETDGPFIRVNNKIIQPNDLQGIYQRIESIIPQFEELIFTNFKRLLIEKDISKQHFYDK